MIKLLPIVEENIKVHKHSRFYKVDILNDKSKKIGEFTLEPIENNIYVNVDAVIDKSERGKGYYKKAILEFLTKNPSITISSIFRSSDAEHAWQSLLKNLPSNFKYEIIKHPEENDSEILLSIKT